MSIIADTLQRLQTQAKRQVTDTTQQPSLALPARGKREPGWHRRPSPLKFWLVGLGMTIGLSGLGLGAYWVGLHLDFAMPSEASLSPGQRLALSNAALFSETPPVDVPASEITQIHDTDPGETRPASAAQKPVEASSTSQDDALPTPSFPLDGEFAHATPSVQEVPESSRPDAGSIHTRPDHLQQKTEVASLSPPKEDTDLSPTQPSTDQNATTTSSPDAFVAPTEELDSNRIKTEILNETGTPLLLEGELDEQPNNLKEVSLPRSLVIDKSPLLSTTSVLTLTQEEIQNLQPLNPSQETPAELLQNAQQLIQTGDYAQAQTMLAPLFQNPPVTWEPWFWMGTAYLGEGRLEQADQYFLSGLARNDKIPHLWTQRALVAQQQGDFQLAVHELRQAETLQPDLPHIHLNMGYAYERMGNSSLANQYFSKFLHLTEGNPEFFSTRKKLFARLTAMTGTPIPTTDQPLRLQEEP